MADLRELHTSLGLPPCPIFGRSGGATYAQPWGFDLAAIDRLVMLWWGDGDVVCGREHTLYLADTLPHVRLVTYPDEGHLAPVNHWREILDAVSRWLSLWLPPGSNYDGGVTQDPAQFSDVVCSFCSRHNREVRVVSTDAGLIICQVCVAKCAQIFDEEVGIDGPHAGGWSTRWPLKTAQVSPPRS